MELTETHLRYLLAIYDLGRVTPDVGAAAIANTLKVSRPSVTRMLNILMDRGLLVRERYGKIYLTDTGFLAARDFKRKVERLQARIPGWACALRRRSCWTRPACWRRPAGERA